MATLTDDAFLAEVDSLIAGRENTLVPKTPEAPTEPPAVVEPPVVVPPVEEPAKTPDTVQPTVVEPPVNPDPSAPTDPAKTPAEPPVEPAAPVEPPVAPTAPDYQAIHARLFGTPIRAGGQDITLNTVDEAISLIQKGVGFHNKMNKVQKDLAIAETLRNAGIDQSQLNLLIDAHQKKPGAIKKLLDSAKIDPLTLDTAEASTYAPSDHSVPEEQVRFQSVITDLTDTPHGTAVLQDARSWDQASKAEVYKNPGVLELLGQQKESGRYDLIKAQVDRQRLLGAIPATEPFLQSYTRVGQQMMQAGAFNPTPVVTPTPTPVAQKVVTPVAPANSKKAAAAAPTRASNPTVTPTAPVTEKMTDAEFDVFFKKTFNI
jgi:hypothetical protein